MMDFIKMILKKETFSDETTLFVIASVIFMKR